MPIKSIPITANQFVNPSRIYQDTTLNDQRSSRKRPARVESQRWWNPKLTEEAVDNEFGLICLNNDIFWMSL